MNIFGRNVKEIVQIACITAILLLLAVFSFGFMTESGKEISHETMPVFIVSALLVVALVNLGLGTYKWYFWIKNPVISKEIFFSPFFFIWFIITIEILLAVSVYYTYYNFPDFKYGFIFDIAGVLIIVGMLYFLVRMVYVSVTGVEAKKIVDIVREGISKK